MVYVRTAAPTNSRKPLDPYAISHLHCGGRGARAQLHDGADALVAANLWNYLSKFEARLIFEGSVRTCPFSVGKGRWRQEFDMIPRSLWQTPEWVL